MTIRTRLGDAWTSAQDEQLRAMARANSSWTDMAARLARNPEDIYRRAHELGVKMRTTPDATWAR